MRHRARRGGSLAWVMALPLALTGCAVPKEINPFEIYRTLSGEADAGRPPPPGMDRPRPNLATVPPRPERPPPEVRDAISAALAADRAEARRPMPARPVPPATAAPGEPPLPAGPPPRPALAAAPAIPWTTEPPRPRATAADPAPAPAAPPPAMPEVAPAPPPPDLLGQPRRP